MNGVINMNVGNGAGVQQMTLAGPPPGSIGGTIGVMQTSTMTQTGALGQTGMTGDAPMVVKKRGGKWIWFRGSSSLRRPDRSSFHTVVTLNGHVSVLVVHVKKLRSHHELVMGANYLSQTGDGVPDPTPSPRSFAIPMEAQNYPGKSLSLQQLIFALNEELKRDESSSPYVRSPWPRLQVVC